MTIIFNEQRTQAIDTATQRRVDIFELRHEEEGVGINWSGIGTVSIEEAEDYIALMQAAIKEAKTQNK